VSGNQADVVTRVGASLQTSRTQYKQHAVRLVMDSGDPVAEIARNFGVHEMTLGKWVKKAREDGQEAGRPLDDDERAELERLRKEVARLRLDFRTFPGSETPDY